MQLDYRAKLTLGFTYVVLVGTWAYIFKVYLRLIFISVLGILFLLKKTIAKNIVFFSPDFLASLKKDDEIMENHLRDDFPLFHHFLYTEKILFLSLILVWTPQVQTFFLIKPIIISFYFNLLLALLIPYIIVRVFIIFFCNPAYTNKFIGMTSGVFISGVAALKSTDLYIGYRANNGPEGRVKLACQYWAGQNPSLIEGAKNAADIAVVNELAGPNGHRQCNEAHLRRKDNPLIPNTPFIVALLELAEDPHPTHDFNIIELQGSTISLCSSLLDVKLLDVLKEVKPSKLDVADILNAKSEILARADEIRKKK